MLTYVIFTPFSFIVFQSMEPLTIEELKSEKCPRISADDLIMLSELRGHSPGRSPAKRNKSAKPKLLIIDVRSPEEYPL